MKASRAITMTLALGLIAAAAAGPVTAADSSGPQPAIDPGAAMAQPGRLTGVVLMGTTGFDPQSIWLMRNGWPGDGSIRLVDAGHLVGPLANDNAPWLLTDPRWVDAQRLRDQRYAGLVAWSDARFIGWLSMAWNRDLHQIAGDPASVDAVSIRLDGDEGSWVGRLMGTGDPRTGEFMVSGTLLGTGAFAGLSAVLAIVNPGRGDGWNIDGLVVSGPLPPFG